jgi:hypothetical protein
MIHPRRYGRRRILDLTFSHPDYTVGSGISPDLRLAEPDARGLYRRSGISVQDSCLQVSSYEPHPVHSDPAPKVAFLAQRFCARKQYTTVKIITCRNSAVKMIFITFCSVTKLS